MTPELFVLILIFASLSATIMLCATLCEHFRNLRQDLSRVADALEDYIYDDEPDDGGREDLPQEMQARVVDLRPVKRAS